MDALIPWLRRTGWAYAAVAVALALVSWRMLAGGPDPVQGPGAPAQVSHGADAAGDPAAANADGAGPRMVVHVAGEVRRPGVYPLAPGARVRGAVARAGGPTRRADLTGLNLAATVRDGQQVVVPARAPATAAAAPAAPGASPSAPLSLSLATAEQLEALDGIGPTLAARIVAHRDERGGFASVDQLLEVRGIGPGRLDALREHVVP